jgi:alanine dehydrogenase
VLVGIPKEVKNNEFRVSNTPAGVHSLVLAGHQVFVEKGAGLGSAITDSEYAKAGATILDTADEVWAKSEMIIKVKEPVAEEYHRMRKGQILFTYLHLAASRECTDAIVKSGITAIAYETVEINRFLPLLAPMSEVAGRMSIQVGAAALQRPAGGRGVLLGGVPGVAPGKVVILGGGSVGVSAAAMAIGLRADVTLLDINLKRLGEIDEMFHGQVKTVASSPYSIEEHCMQADLVVGGVLIPGAAATTHADPTFKVHNSLYYCVANMPGAVPATSTAALSNATLKYSLALANKGWQKAMEDDAALAAGLNVHEGKIMYAAVAAAHG